MDLVRCCLACLFESRIADHLEGCLFRQRFTPTGTKRLGGGYAQRYANPMFCLLSSGWWVGPLVRFYFQNQA